MLWHRQGGLCHWCGYETVLPEALVPGGDLSKYPGRPPKHTATLEHLHSRLHSGRGANQRVYKNVMACMHCNNEHAALEQLSLPDAVRRASGRQKEHGNNEMVAYTP